MNIPLRYLGASKVVESGGTTSLRFAPNLARKVTFFDGELRRPVEFREAISALHDVVIGDLRFARRDKSAYRAWKAEQAQAEETLRRSVSKQAARAELARLAQEPVPDGLDGDFRRLHRLYWRARRQWASELSRQDPEMFRHLVPCDPVVTVAPDVVFFECFSKDEASYGCLQVDRELIASGQEAGLGTTNVDYSLPLYDHFQSLRSYRPTRLVVDPAGFTVAVAGQGELREEKIDLPASWLRGFGQLQAAMTLPSRRLDLSPGTVYSLLAHLRRHRERTGPRCLRFRLAPGERPEIVLEPWGLVVREPRLPSEPGPPAEIKVWGRRRLFALARLLPICDRVEVRLLGSGLPSLWIAHLPGMRFVLALSGWTANDWSAGASLDLVAGMFGSDPTLVDRLDGLLATTHAGSLGSLVAATGRDERDVAAALHQLAKRGQVVYDHAGERYRHRPVMPFAPHRLAARAGVARARRRA